MRLNISLRFLDQSGIPIHYNYWLQSAIYRMMDGVMADQVHARGFAGEGRTFRLFTFSRLLGRYELSPDKKHIRFPEGANWIISSPITDILGSIAGGLLKQNTITVGTARADIVSIQSSHPRVEKGMIRVRTLSPVVAYSTMFRGDNSKYTVYFQPGEPEFQRLVSENLNKKTESIHTWLSGTSEKRRLRQDAVADAETAGEEKQGDQQVAAAWDTLELRMRKTPRLHIVEYKGGVIKGYSGDMELKGPPALLQVALDAGLGSKNAQGFGCLEEIR